MFLAMIKRDRANRTEDVFNDYQNLRFSNQVERWEKYFKVNIALSEIFCNH